MTKPDRTRDAIRKLIAKKGSATGPELAAALGITRQAISLHLRQMIAAGQVYKSGSTRAARYFPGNRAPAPRHTRLDLALPGLDESGVYSKVAFTMNLAGLPPNVEAITHYAFTEMLNNAIDHSLSYRCSVDVRLDAAKFSFSIRDRGIGVFQSIASKNNLEDEPAAMIELIKGKTTTKPDAHSGEGIFFVSKAADRFVLRSHRLQLEWDRDRDDVFVSDQRFTKGTLVQFEIRKDSRTRLDDVFAAYAPVEFDYRFEKTRVQVKLLRSDYVSRSEAKRLLHNLDRFSEIELDFRGVGHVGQGFADEVFRVFAASHPEIVIRISNAAEPVAAMVRHVTGIRGQ